jgi:hypothetical protein
VSIIVETSTRVSSFRQGQFVGTTIFGNENMKAALERLKKLTDGEEHLVSVITHPNTQHIVQMGGRIEQIVGK